MSFPEIKAAIEQTAEAFDAFRQTNDERVAGLVERLETLESKSGHPGIAPASADSLGDLAAKALHADLELLEKTRTLRVEVKAASDPVTTASGRAIMWGGMGAPQGGVLGLQNGLPQRRVEGVTAVEYSRFTGTEGAAAQQASEGADKAQMRPTFSLITQTAMTIAAYTKVSRQALADVAEVSSVVNTVLRRSIDTALDVALCSGATGFSGGYEGLATAYTSLVYTALPDAVSEGVATMQQAGFSPNVVFLNPADWLAATVARGTANDHYLSGSYLGALPSEMRGLRVVLSPSVDAGKALVADTAHSELVFVGGFAFEAAYAGDDFTKNLLTLLAEIRVAPVFRTAGSMRLITPKAL